MDNLPENDNLKDPKTYEVGFLLSPLVAEDKVPEVVNKTVRGALETASGVVVSEVFPKLRPLAYSIKVRDGGKSASYRDAYFGAIKFQLRPEKLASVKAALTRQAELIRFLLIIAAREMVRPVRRPIVRERIRPATPTETTPILSQEEIDRQIEELLTTTSS